MKLVYFLVLLGTIASFRLAQCGVMEDVKADVSRLCSRFCVAKTDRECKKGLIPEPDIYAPMDSITGFKSAATGADVTVRGSPKPTTQAGAFGKSIYLTNMQTIDDKYIDLGYQRDRCVDNLRKCKKGLTVSMWYWLSTHNRHDWPCIISGTQWQINTYKMPEGNVNEPYFIFYKDDPTKMYMVGGHNNLTYTNEKWHHVTFVYRSYDDVRFFVDGELIADANRYHKNFNMRDNNVQVGCYGTGNCMRGKFDELKIWESALSNEDVKKLYLECKSC